MPMMRPPSSAAGGYPEGMEFAEIAHSPQPESCPWGRKAVRRLGKNLVDGSPLNDGDPSLEEYIGWHTDIVGFLWAALEMCEWDRLLGDDVGEEITGRPKTDETLREKLIRLPTHPLHSIQDVAGVRFEAMMTLDQQDDVAKHITQLFEMCGWKIIEHNDLRSGEHYGGYRAVHLVLERSQDRARAEIQIRTHLQGEWANYYELLADVLGRGIRYGELPSDPRLREHVERWQDVSRDLISRLEGLRNKHHSTDGYKGRSVKEIAEEIERVHDQLREMIQGGRRTLKERIELL